MSVKKSPLLKVENVSISFPKLNKHTKDLGHPVVHQLDFTVQKGEIIAIVGASGSGKSLLADAILGILPKHAQVSGLIEYEGRPLSEKLRTQLRGKEICLIPQSVNALDPLMKVGKQVEATIKTKNKATIREQLFTKVGLAKDTADKYPFELSGGMQRRVLVTTVLGKDTKLIIADEPTPGLDPAVLEDTVNELRQMVTKQNAMIFITHDITVALQIAHKVVVFKEGKTVEIAEVNQFEGLGEKLKNSYTRQLWNALPQNKFIQMKDIETQEKKSLDVLQASSISYRHKNGPTLFKNIDFTLHTDEVIGLYGPSGFGKTTFAQLLSGYKMATNGEIYVNNEQLLNHEYPPVQLIWQHPEQVINPKWNMKKMLEEVGEIDEILLRKLEIKKERLLRKPKELSGGELQRFCIARALMTDASFLIADEMTTMLDAVTQKKLWEVLLSYAKERGIGVLVISHDTFLLQKISDRIINFTELSSNTC